MTGAVARKTIVIPRALRKRVIGSAGLAEVMDKPCPAHRGTKPKDSIDPATGERCKTCDRWDSQRARRFMRSRGIATTDRASKQGHVGTTLLKLISLDDIGDIVLQLIPPEQLRDLIR